MQKMKDNRAVYIESSVISHLTVRAARDLRVAAFHAITTEWWDIQRPSFELYTSDLTIKETEGVHPAMAPLRLKALQGMTVLPITNAVESLNDALLQRHAFRGNAATHVAVAAVHNIPYLLTWDFRQINNSVITPIIAEVCEELGYRSPVTCSPEQLTGGIPMPSDEIMEELWEIRRQQSTASRRELDS